MLKKSLIKGFEVKQPDVEVIKKKLNKTVKKEVTSTKVSRVSKKTSIPEKLNIIEQEVNKILGKYKDIVEVIYERNRFHAFIDNSIKNGVIAIDTETNNSLEPVSCKIMGLCLYTPFEKAVYIPVHHINYITNEHIIEQLTEEDIKEELQRLVDNNVKIVMHNAKFDVRVIKNTCKINLRCYWDTMLGAKLLNENETDHGGSYGLKWQYAHKVDKESAVYNIETFFENIEYAVVDPSIFALYAAIDAYATYKLYLYQVEQYDKPENSRLKDVLLNIEMAVLPAVADMEDNGVHIDFEFSKKLSEKYHKKLDEINDKINALLDENKEQIDFYKLKNPDHKLSDPILISSPSQLATLLYDIFKCETVDKSKPRGTGEEILQKINHPICKLILEYREIQKLLTTYIDKLPETVNEVTGKIHASFNQYGAGTGRFSSNNPNLQIRMMFIPSPGNVIIGGDFSQQEPRLLANFSRDEAMMKAYEDGKDLYATIASGVYKNDYWDNMETNKDGTANAEGKVRRGNCKSLLLGIMYGRGVASVAEQIKGTTEEAQKIIDDFYKSFPKVKDWMDKTNEFAEKYGYVETLWGRRRRLPDILLKPYEITCETNTTNFNPLFEDISSVSIENEQMINKYFNLLQNCKSFRDKQQIKEQALQEGVKIKDNGGFIAQAKRQCVNARIQGSAADMSKKAMTQIHDNEELNKLGFKMLFVVHDEITGECPIENADKVAELLSKTMINCAKDKCDVKMKCDTYTVKRWYEDDFSNMVNTEYNKLLKGDPKKNILPISPEEAWLKIKENHEEINELYLREMCDGTYVCGIHDQI